MDPLVHLWETPENPEMYMIAGWQQWADAGEVSSGLPRYLIHQTHAVKIGEIAEDGFYLFQIPGTHHLLRRTVKLSEGYCRSMSERKNEIYYADFGPKGLIIFCGEEPHLNEVRYADAFFDVAEALRVKRIVAMGGVFGAMPYDKDREVSCVYSLPRMKRELDLYAVRFSNYEGGTTIGSYLAHRAEAREIEYIVFNAFAPAYDFAQLAAGVQGMRVEEDWKAWYDLMVRIEHMFGLGLDLSDLRQRSLDLIEAWHDKVRELERTHPDLHLQTYLNEIAKEFTERTFIPLDDAWNELGDMLNELDDDEDTEN